MAPWIWDSGSLGFACRRAEAAGSASFRGITWKQAERTLSPIVLWYHPTWHFGTVAAMRFGTLHSLLSEAASALAWRKLGESSRGCSVDGFAQGHGVPYLTLS